MSALEDLLRDFSDNTGTMPQVNGPEAAKVLATQTAPEVAGEPEPPPAAEPPPPPTEKPQSVKDAEAAGKVRRTAAVVQVELDEALREIARLKAGGAVATAQAVVEAATQKPLGGPTIDLHGAMHMVKLMLPAGTSVTIQGAGI